MQTHQVRSAVEEVASNCEAAGIKAGSPLRTILIAAARESEAMQASITGLNQAIQGVNVVTPQGLADLEMAAVRGADRRANVLARAHSLRTLLGIGCVVAIAALVGSVVGFTVGRATVQQTEARLMRAFMDGPDGAEEWAKLMERNDVRGALALCTGPRVFTDKSGRRACNLPVYIEPIGRSAQK